jgi:hypothetical protein
MVGIQVMLILVCLRIEKLLNKEKEERRRDMKKVVMVVLMLMMMMETVKYIDLGLVLFQ